MLWLFILVGISLCILCQYVFAKKFRTVGFTYEKPYVNLFNIEEWRFKKYFELNVMKEDKITESLISDKVADYIENNKIASDNIKVTIKDFKRFHRVTISSLSNEIFTNKYIFEINKKG
ncbi:hypothetical protein NPX79_00900 [Spiroplasma endosymbiont of Anurida maritima]|uniref:hypothetical protein n=1 Tax=Spiroplasma endosymbiont of Anurida maritima TaxID=2967972 RepID=UPI0036D3652C